MDSGENAERGDEYSPQEWLRRLTVKVEPEEESAETAKGSSSAYTPSVASGSSSKGDRRESKKKSRKKRHKAPKAERLLTPKDAPLYTPALAPSKLPFGFSQTVKSGENEFSTGQLQLLGLAEGTTGLWRMHAKSGVNYRKGPFTTEERLLIEEALEQYAQREGFESVEEAVKNLSGNVGRKSSGRFHSIARCLPERPFVSVYGYIRRRMSGSAKRGPWTAKETEELLQLVKSYPKTTRGRWVKIAAVLNRRPPDVCDKWRTLQPRLQHLESASVPALEDNKTENGANIQHANKPANDDFSRGSRVAPEHSFTEKQKQLLLQEVQQKTGEELPSFGIPWKRIQKEHFANYEEAFLRQMFCLILFPAELERRMATKPRPVILRHILRCLSRLHAPLPPQLRGVEWLEILPFVPASLQREVVRSAAGPVTREKGFSLDAAIPHLIDEYKNSLEATRKKDAFRLLKAILPVAMQEALEAQVTAKAALKGWPEKTVKTKFKSKIRKAAAEELERLKARLQEVRATPLNAPPRGRGQQALPAPETDANETVPVAILDGDLMDAETSELLATPFTDEVTGATMALHLARKSTSSNEPERQLERSDSEKPAATHDASEAASPTAEIGPLESNFSVCSSEMNENKIDSDDACAMSEQVVVIQPKKRRIAASTFSETANLNVASSSKPARGRRKKRSKNADRDN